MMVQYELTAFTPHKTTVPPVCTRADPSAVDTDPGGVYMGAIFTYGNNPNHYGVFFVSKFEPPHETLMKSHKNVIKYCSKMRSLKNVMRSFYEVAQKRTIGCTIMPWGL